MKHWSPHWKGSIRPSKQRKYTATAPLHIKGHLLAAHLSKELRQKHKRRSIRVRKGDKVNILRGSFKGTSGTVERVDTTHICVYVSGATLTKKDGTKIARPIHPSKLLITQLDTTDKRRFAESKPEMTRKANEPEPKETTRP
ncbi:50S ribosomal protein L24 [Candidatus Woesearchaeota archaeon]|nr:50S ribosomal protein L24 [Candidatus Woesearchaeota archaeon]